MSLDSSSLLDTAVITKFTLKIDNQGVVGTNQFTAQGGWRVDIRKPYFGAGAGLLAGDFQAAASGATVTTFGAPAGTWYSAILSAPGRSFVNRTGPTQFRLRFTLDDNNDHGADYMKFYSGNAASANRPQLIVQYSLP